MSCYDRGSTFWSKLFLTRRGSSTEELSDTVVVTVFLTLIYRYSAARGHRKGSNNSGAEDYLRRKTNKQNIVHTITETNRIPQTKVKRWDQRTYVSRYISYHMSYHMLDDSQQKPKPRRQHITHKKKTGWKKRCPNRNRKREGREGIYISIYI